MLPSDPSLVGSTLDMSCQAPGRLLVSPQGAFEPLHNL